MNEYPVDLGWNQTEHEDQAIVRADDYLQACIHARTGWGKAWSSVVVHDPDQPGVATEVAVHRSDDKTLDPEAWCRAKLAPPVETAIITVDQFVNAFMSHYRAEPDIPPEVRPVWILLDGMLYLPQHIALGDGGAIVIAPAPVPSGIAPRLPEPPAVVQ